MTETTNGKGLEERIVRLYRAVTGSENDRGAKSWFAEQVKRHPSTVARWISGDHPIEELALEKLETLERQAADQLRAQADRKAEELLAAQSPSDE